MFPILPTILLLMPVIATSQMCAAVTKIGKQTRHLSKPVHWLTTQYHFAFADWWTERAFVLACACVCVFACLSLAADRLP